MEVVQAFHAELSSLYEMKPPISKAKMNQITKSAIKGIKMYKHIVLSVERFIAKCRPEYKLPGLYVVDSIVRQSRHQFGPDKDVFGPRFTRNFQQTFQSLFRTCPPDDRPKIVRVLNLWQRNNVFSSEIIQPLLDMANPNAQLKESSPGASGRHDPNELKANDSNLVLQLLANTIVQANKNNSNNNLGSAGSSQSQIRFNKKLLDFDYGEDDDDEEKGETPTEAEPPTSRALGNNKDDADTNPLALTFAQNLLSNPELLQLMQHNMQQQHALNSQLPNTSIQSQSGSAFVASFQPISESNKMSLDARIDAQNNFPYSQYMREQAQDNNNSNLNAYGGVSGHHDQAQFDRSQQQFHSDQKSQSREASSAVGNERRERRGRDMSSRSPSPRRSRFSRNPNERDSRRRSRSRSPNNWRSGSDRRSHRSPGRQQERALSPESKERERERDRRRRGLPPIRKGYLTICSTTLWLGHVPKLVSEADISNAFGEFGTINSIDLIPPRGCAYVAMDRRQDAYSALQKSKSLKLQGNQIKVAWAPGKGTKGKEFKDYWDVELGASFVPNEKIVENADFDFLEEGGMFDEDTIPLHLQEMRKRKAKEKEDMGASAMEGVEVNNSGLPPVSYNHLSAHHSSHHHQGIESSFVPSSGGMGPEKTLLSIGHGLPLGGGHFSGLPGSSTSSPAPNVTASSSAALLTGPPFSNLPLNLPPPSVLSGQRPPPLSAWSNPPPPLMSGPNSTPLPPPPFRPSLAPPQFSQSLGSVSGGDGVPVFPPPAVASAAKEDDPFAPSAYELKAMKSGGRFALPPVLEQERERFFEDRVMMRQGPVPGDDGQQNRPGDWSRGRDSWGRGGERDRGNRGGGGDRNSRHSNSRDGNRRDRGNRWSRGRDDRERGDGDGPESGSHDRSRRERSSDHQERHHTRHEGDKNRDENNSIESFDQREQDSNNSLERESQTSITQSQQMDLKTDEAHETNIDRADTDKASRLEEGSIDSNGVFNSNHEHEQINSECRQEAFAKSEATPSTNDGIGERDSSQQIEHYSSVKPPVEESFTDSENFRHRNDYFIDSDANESSSKHNSEVDRVATIKADFGQENSSLAVQISQQQHENHSPHENNGSNGLREDTDAGDFGPEQVQEAT